MKFSVYNFVYMFHYQGSFHVWYFSTCSVYPSIINDVGGVRGRIKISELTFIYIDSFQVNVSFLYPPRTLEFLVFSGVLKGDICLK